MATVKMVSRILAANSNRASLVLYLALCCLYSSPSFAASLCNDDQVEIEFPLSKSGVLSLRDIRTKEIAGSNQARDAAVPLSSPGTLSGHVIEDRIVVSELRESAFPGLETLQPRIERKIQRAWEVEFPKGLYEFSSKNDLEFDVLIEVVGGAASGISSHRDSQVSLTVQSGQIHEIWWGGTNSLRRVWGDLVFNYTDVHQLNSSGVHRATITMCLSIRGYL
jgi:hypothetical protein